MKRKTWWLVLILLLAAGLRFFRLDARSLWFDEALSVLIGRLTLQQVLAGAAGSSHPPGYYLLLHLWQALGTSDWLLRYPSVFASLLSVSLAYRLGVSLFDRRAGLVAALGMAISPLQVYYAQETRMYALVTALALGTVWCLLRAVQGPRSAMALVGYAVLAVLGLYTHYYVAWVLLSVHVWLLLNGRRFRDLWVPLGITDFGIGLAFFPQLGQAVREAGEFMGKDWRGRPNPLAPLAMPEYLLFGHAVPIFWWWAVRVAVAMVLLAFVLLELARGRKRAWRRQAGLVLLVAALPPSLVVAISWLVQPLYQARSFVVLAPFLVLFLAQGIAGALPKRSPIPWVGSLLGALMLLGVMLSFSRPDVAKPETGEAMTIVARDFQEGDLCLHLDETYPTALVYQPLVSPALLDAGQAYWLRPEVYQLLGGRIVSAKDLPVKERLWLVVADRSSQPWEALLKRIGDEKRVEDVWRWDQLTLYLYDG